MPSLIKIILFAGMTVAATHPANLSWQSEEQRNTDDSGTYTLLSPNRQFLLSTYISENNRGALIQLTRFKDKHIIWSLPLPKQQARGFSGLWSSNSGLLALIWKDGFTNDLKMHVYRVKSDGASEIRLPKPFGAAMFLPKNDPVRQAHLSTQAIEPLEWANDQDLVCSVIAVAHLIETPVTKGGYVTIAYEVILRSVGDKMAIVKFERTQYENTGEDFQEQKDKVGDEAQRMRHHRRGAAAGSAIDQVNLGWMYHLGVGGLPQDDKKAVDLYRKAAEQGSPIGQAYLASAYTKGDGVERDYDKARELFNRAMGQGFENVLNDLAWFLATCPDENERNGTQAVAYATAACILTAWEDRNFIGTLAAAYAETGDFENATKYQRQALDTVGNYPDDHELEELLQVYTQHKPYREE